MFSPTKALGRGAATVTATAARHPIADASTRSTTVLGKRTSRLGITEPRTLRPSERLQHVLTIGATGTGKTVLLDTVAQQDVRQDHGCCLINPKGDLVDAFLAKLPPDRRDDVIYINPGCEPVTPINVLEPSGGADLPPALQAAQTECVVADVIDLVRRQSTNWGDQFGRILDVLLRAHLAVNSTRDTPPTLLDVYECLVNPTALTDLINEVPDPLLRETLITIREEKTARELEPLQRRLNDFVLNPTIQRLIGTPESGVDFQAALAEGHIIVVDVPKGVVGPTVARLTGSIVLTKLWAAAQQRVTQSAAERSPFYLFVDELHNFAGDGGSFTTLLSEGREYGLGCWLATQYLEQVGPALRRALTTNCLTKVVFTPGSTADAQALAAHLGGVDAATLSSLGAYRAVLQAAAGPGSADTTIIETFPPREGEPAVVPAIKAAGTTAGTPIRLGLQPRLGPAQNAGGDRHTQLLEAAKQQLEAEGCAVTLLYQPPGAELPDGYVTLPDGDRAHLEAEVGGLSKPARVLTNLQRAVDAECACIFAVEADNADTLRAILDDPVNRQRDEAEDAAGPYGYYRLDGEPFTHVEALKTADYRILELGEETLSEAVGGNGECPERAHHGEDTLATFCLYRDDGTCSLLGEPCPYTKS